MKRPETIQIDGKPYKLHDRLNLTYGPKHIGEIEIAAINDERTFVAQFIGTYNNRTLIAQHCKVAK